MKTSNIIILANPNNTMKKEYLYKIDKKGKLVSSPTVLADPNHGAVIKSFRKMEENKSKLLHNFWI